VNQAILITGGGKRIGSAIGRTLANDGWDIALHYRTSTQEAEETAGYIHSLGRTCCLFQADFNQMGEVRALIPSVFDKMPHVRAMVNSVSLFGRAKMMETSEALFDSHFQVNLKAPFFLSQSFAMRVQEGHIINILDTRISKHTIQYFVYSMTKKSLKAFTQMAARELGPAIRVNAVAPGLILPSVDSENEAFIKMEKKIPLQQTGEPDDIASTVLFLLRSKFITGECIFVDGGERLM